MPSINTEHIASQMLARALPILKQRRADAEALASAEFTLLAETLVSIGDQLRAGDIDLEQAALLLELQRSAVMDTLLALQGLGYLTVEAAINAALDTVRTAVNTAAGSALIG